MHLWRYLNKFSENVANKRAPIFTFWTKTGMSELITVPTKAFPPFSVVYITFSSFLIPFYLSSFIWIKTYFLEYSFFAPLCQVLNAMMLFYWNWKRTEEQFYRFFFASVTLVFNEAFIEKCYKFYYILRFPPFIIMPVFHIIHEKVLFCKWYIDPRERIYV